jgi:hypothetical protein
MCNARSRDSDEIPDHEVNADLGNPGSITGVNRGRRRMRQAPSWVAATWLLLLASASGLGQEAKAPAAQQEAMKKLGFLAGRWKGESWMESAPGQRSASVGTETVESKLDGLLLVIEGVHRRKVGDKEAGDIVHQAFAVVSFDEKAKRYRFQAHTDRGNYTETEAKVADGRLEWGFRLTQAGEVRYTITVTEPGHWTEIGEISSDGKQWRKFFEMTLERVRGDGKGDVPDR